ncbi:MAG: hypothetical protein IKT68_07445 [Clostridia bacterium]|nr:hypothetical protein [Clostridia bacterium]
MKKVIMLILACLLCFSLTACSGDADVTGTWEATIPMSEVTAGELDGDATMVMTLNEDGTGTLTMDDATVEAILEAAVAQQGISMDEFLEATQKSKQEAMEELGLNMDQEIKWELDGDQLSLTIGDEKEVVTFDGDTIETQNGKFTRK